MTSQAEHAAFSAPFWSAIEEGRLVVQRCTACRHEQLYPRRRCLKCGGADLGFDMLSGDGHLYTFTVIRKYPPSQFVDDLPYVLGVIRLIEGPRLLTRVINSTILELVCEMPMSFSPSVVHGKLLPTFEPSARADERE